MHKDSASKYRSHLKMHVIMPTKPLIHGVCLVCCTYHSVVCYCTGDAYMYIGGLCFDIDQIIIGSVLGTAGTLLVLNYFTFTMRLCSPLKHLGATAAQVSGKS